MAASARVTARRPRGRRIGSSGMAPRRPRPRERFPIGRLRCLGAPVWCGLVRSGRATDLGVCCESRSMKGRIQREVHPRKPLDGDVYSARHEFRVRTRSTRRRVPPVGADGRPARRGGPRRRPGRATVTRRTGKACSRIGRLTCRDCAGEFVFSSGEQTFFSSKGLLNDPQRCPSCRAVAKRARTVGGPREFHAAICGNCGGQAVVPFAPRNDRPVYCSTCFDKVRAGTISETASV